jgi:hypothetical protein
MTAIVKTSIRIPEDAFPTITKVPGAMITFKYYVEVVIDLQGKLAGQERFLPRMNMTSSPYNSGATAQRHDVRDENGNQIMSWNGSIMDTDVIRRERSVVNCLFEVIVGSRDSGRSRRLFNESQTRDSQYYDIGDEQSYDEYLAWQHSMSPEEYYQGGDYDYYEYGYEYDANQPGTPTATHVVPPPELEEEIDEKARLRRAEEMLFPSRPPEDEPGPSAIPTAPTLEYDHPSDTYTVYENQSTIPLTAATSAPSIDTIVPPFNDDSTQSPTHESPPTDDKHELERRRLMAQASAPDMDSDDGGPAESSQAAAATAPVLTEDDEYNHLENRNYRIGESLPRYQR